VTIPTSETSFVVGRSEDIVEGGRLVVEIDGLELGIFRIHGSLVAYENYCVHAGGPICQGMIINRVEEILDAGKVTIGERFSPTDVHIVCPWHGYEYNLATGIHPGSPKDRLTPHAVTEEGGEIRVQR
jgi:nitrite reductase/ring-hydroxylating ferredoxin subunit